MGMNEARGRHQSGIGSGSTSVTGRSERWWGRRLISAMILTGTAGLVFITPATGLPPLAAFPALVSGEAGPIVHQAAKPGAASLDEDMPARAIERVLPSEGDTLPRANVPIKVPDGAVEPFADLRALANTAELVFDGVLTSARTTTPAGLRVLTTEYTFEVSEWLKGGVGNSISLTNLGGELPDGNGMTTVDSLKLTQGDRYVVFVKKNGTQILVPFLRVFQVHQGGAVVANAAGRILVQIEEGRPLYRQEVEIRSLDYLPGTPATPLNVSGPPEFPSEPLPEQPKSPSPADMEPMSVDDLLEALHNAGLGSVKPVDFESRMLNQPGTGTGDSDTDRGPRWNYCGYHRNYISYYCYIPNNNNWTWFNNAGSDWNHLVENNPSGPDWLIGYKTSGGNPIRDRLPTAGDDKHNCGVVTSAQLTNGGYPTWAAMNNANGVNFTWYTGGDCTEIEEMDTFVNPVIQNDELQFRKTMPHEFGHALTLGHVDNHFALLYSGTWRQPPNYASNWYTRLNDNAGVRSMLGWVNGNWAGTWVFETWADMATWSQSHDNPGSPGNLVMTDLSTYSVPQLGSVDIRHMQVENRGNAAVPTTVWIKVYLSTNTTISAADHQVYGGTWANFGSQTQWANGTLTLTVPMSVPAGNYYIGWILTTDTSELTTGNNTAIMMRNSANNFSERTITVRAVGSCCIDGDCVAAMEQSACIGSNGTWHEGEDCSPDPCLGACCEVGTGVCNNNVASDACPAPPAGAWYEGLSCDDPSIVCGLPEGACCETDTGICFDDFTLDACPPEVGTWYEGSDCNDPNVICSPPDGACCAPYTCTEGITCGGDWPVCNGTFLPCICFTALDGSIECIDAFNQQCGRQCSTNDSCPAGSVCLEDTCCNDNMPTCIKTGCPLVEPDGGYDLPEGGILGDRSLEDFLAEHGRGAGGQCEEMDAATCQVFGGLYQGDGVSCANTVCPGPPTGACCADDYCENGMDEATCLSDFGTWFEGQSCDAAPCPGACCPAYTCTQGAVCEEVPPFPGCNGVFGCTCGETFEGGFACVSIAVACGRSCPNGTSECDPGTVCVIGSCCGPVCMADGCGIVGREAAGKQDGSAFRPLDVDHLAAGGVQSELRGIGGCQEMDRGTCEDFGGTYQGIGTDCNDTSCPDEGGACCIRGQCLDLADGRPCVDQGGAWHPGVSCASNPCPVLEQACCGVPKAPLGCFNATPAECYRAGGFPKGPGTKCLGDASGNSLDDACDPTDACEHCGPGDHWMHKDPWCPEGTDTLPSGATVGIDLTGNCEPDLSLRLHGDATVVRSGPMDDSLFFPGLRAVDNHRDVIDTVMASMVLSNADGVTLLAGGGAGMIPLLPTLGAIAEQVDPAWADSFFDVFFEVHDGSGSYYYNQTPLRVVQKIDCLPPDTDYIHTTTCLPLYTSPRPGAGTRVANLVTADHNTYLECGDEDAGDCYEPHNTPFCDGRVCCERICEQKPECCEVEWHGGCAELAAEFCPPAEPGACCFEDVTCSAVLAGSCTAQCPCDPDMNCDRVLNEADVEPFKLALTDPTAYLNQYPNCNIDRADIDCDGDIDELDWWAFGCILHIETPPDCMNIDAQSCSSHGGTPMGSDTVCSSTSCPRPGGACCIRGQCLDLTDGQPCTDQGGEWHPGVSCESNPCRVFPQACCGVVDSRYGCLNLVPEECYGVGGFPKGPGTLCLGDASGNNLDDACDPTDACAQCGPGVHWMHTHPWCPANTDTLPSGATVGIDLTDNCEPDLSLRLHGDATVVRSGPMDDSLFFPGLKPVDTHLDVIDTEMVSMVLSNADGVTLLAGGGAGMIPLLPTLGAIAEQADPAWADSFFDVFFEVHDGRGNYYYNQTPLRVAQKIDCLPPDTDYIHTTTCLPLYTSPHPGLGTRVANLVTADHNTYLECGDEDAGDCYEPHNTPFCDDQGCCKRICEKMPYCCEVEWSDNCAGMAGEACPRVEFGIWRSVGAHGIVGDVGLELVESGVYVEPRRRGINKIVVDFSGAIDPTTAGAGGVSLVGCDVHGALDLSGINITTVLNPANTQMEIIFTPKLPGSEPNPSAGPLAARYRITLNGIKSTGGSPVTGTASRDLMTVLGDVWGVPNGSGQVTTADYGVTRSLAAAGINPISTTNVRHVRADVTGDGRITSADAGLVRSMAAQGRDGTGLICP